MLSECIYTSGGGGGGEVNPTIIQNWSQSAAISYTYNNYDSSKTYLLIEVYKTTLSTYDSVKVIKGGEATRILGTDSICTLTISGTSLSITAGSGSYVKYVVFLQLD